MNSAPPVNTLDPNAIADLKRLDRKQNIRAIKESPDRVHIAIIAQMDRDTLIPAELVGFREIIAHRDAPLPNEKGRPAGRP